MTEQWQELKETITEMRDNDGTGTQQDVCKFLADYMEVLEKQMQQPCEDCISREAVDNYIVKLMSGYLYDEERTRLEDLTAYIWELPSVTPNYNSIKTELNPSEDCISREAVIKHICESKECYKDECKGRLYKRCFDLQWIYDLPFVTPQQTRWIPVSERYPKIEDEYKYFLVTDDKGKVSIQEFFISLDEEPQPYFSGMVNVIAWMPLPEPYEAESEERNDE